MPSFDTVNYSLRPSKGIQRQIVFEGVRLLQSAIDLESMAYIGFGSIWFSDFIAAHKMLQVEDMISIEANDVGFERALFNKPYATIRVKHGISGEVLPTLYGDDVIKQRPWLIWLDYDYAFDESVRDDVRSLIENSPTNSIVILTFKGHEMAYGRPQDRPARLKEVFGSVVPDDLEKNQCKDDQVQELLSKYSIDYMRSVAAEISRPGGFIPAFRIVYKDSIPMVTVGGILPAKGAVSAAKEIIDSPSWCCMPTKSIVAPHLTMREANILQSQLPRQEPITREIVKALGFDLEQEQIDTFQRYYKQYPAFAQIHN